MLEIGINKKNHPDWDSPDPDDTREIKMSETQKMTNKEVVPATPTAIDLVSAALAQGAGPDQVAGLIELVKFNDNREALKSFNKAFTEAQSQIPTIARTKKAHNSMYAPYDKIVQAIRPVLESHGFSFRHNIATIDGAISVTCILAHKDGHSEQTTLEAAPDTSGSKNSIQSRGSTVTYLKRYTLEAVIGIVTSDEDNDGGAPVETITEEQQATIRDMLEEHSADKAKFMRWAKINALSEINVNAYNGVIAMIKRKH